MNPQQLSVATPSEQKAAPAASVSIEQQWEAAAMALLCAEIDRIDAVAANTAASAEEDKFVMIDGSLYVKAWLISEKEEAPGSGLRQS